MTQQSSMLGIREILQCPITLSLSRRTKDVGKLSQDELKLLSLQEIEKIILIETS